MLLASAAPTMPEHHRPVKGVVGGGHRPELEGGRSSVTPNRAGSAGWKGRSPRVETGLVERKRGERNVTASYSQPC